MRWYRVTVFLLCCSFLSISSFAQNKWAGYGLETNYYSGKILRHSPKFPTILPKSVNSVELNMVYQTYGTQDWHSRRGYPLLGFGFTYSDYGIDSIYGKCISIYPNLEIPLIRKNKFEWVIRAGFGLGFMTKRYERYPTFDTINTAIGSRMNNYSIFTTDLRYRVNKHLDVQVGGNFSHVSNAAFRTPNLGINTYGAHVGIRYFPVNAQPERVQQESPKLPNRWLAQLRVGLSAREEVAPDGPFYPVYLITAFASKRYWSKNKLLIGADYSYHTNVEAFLKNNEIDPGSEKANSWTSSLFVGNEFLIGRAGIMLQLGVYLKRTPVTAAAIYQKLGGNYYLIQREEGLLKELCGYIYLKTHTSEAELVEVGFGFGF